MPRLSALARPTIIVAVLGLALFGALRERTARLEHHAKVASPSESRWSRTPDDGKPIREPNQWFFVERAWPQMQINRDAWQQAQIEARVLLEDFRAKSNPATQATWTLRGPTNVGGRVTSIAVDPRNHDVVYAGAAEGGVMRSRNGGLSWDLVFDDQPSLAIGALAIDPVNPDVVYAGTGEVNPGGGSVAYGGTGLYRSTDQGDTWTNIGLENGGAIGRIVIDPADPQRLFVAVMGHLWSPGPDRGVYRTLDGGDTWQLVLAVDGTTGCVDLIQRPDQPNVVLAAMWQRIRTPERYDYGGPGCAVWRTDDGGDSWSVVGGGLPVPGPNLGRIGLALCRNQPDRMYAVYADRIGYFAGLYRSNNGGVTWTRTSDGALSNVFASYGWWFGNVRCHPDNPDIVFVLGLDFYRSLNGGSSWSETSGGMHVDHHGMNWGPGPDRVIYVGNDAGVYRSNNGGSVWTHLPDQPITQVYRLGLDANNANALYLGGQDISTVRTLTGQLDDWSEIFGGDGFQPLIHPQNSNRIWVQYQYGVVYYSGNNAASFSYAGSGISGSDRMGWNAPHVQDPTNVDRRYFGSNRVYRNTTNTAWSVISGDLTGGPHQNQSGQVRGTLTTIAVSPLDGQVIWAGSDDGRVHVTVNGGGVWTNVSAGLPERWITSVRCDPFVRETAYVTVSGFRWDEPLSHVLMTENLGAVWQPIAANLPEAPVNDLLAYPHQAGRLFVATDVGVFETSNAGASWAPVADGMPSVVVSHLAWSEARGELLAGTYGRSVYAASISPVTSAPEGGPVALADLGRVRPPYPNPTSGGTTFAWDLARAGTVTLEVFSVSGRRIYEVTVDRAVEGPGSLAWDGRDRDGRPAAAGVYLARVMVDGRLLGRETVVLSR